MHKFKYLLFTSEHEVVGTVNDNDDDSLFRGSTGPSLVAIARGLVEALSPSIESKIYSYISLLYNNNNNNIEFIFLHS